MSGVLDSDCSHASVGPVGFPSPFACPLKGPVMVPAWRSALLFRPAGPYGQQGEAGNHQSDRRSLKDPHQAYVGVPERAAQVDHCAARESAEQVEKAVTSGPVFLADDLAEDGHG